nr:hypothetical protein [Sedimentibacter sp.]
MEKNLNKIRIICKGDPITVFYNRVRHEGLGKYKYLIDDVKVAESTSLIIDEYLKSDDLVEEKETIGQKYLLGKVRFRQLFFEDIKDYESLIFRCCALFFLPLATICISIILFSITKGMFSFFVNF